MRNLRFHFGPGCVFFLFFCFAVYGVEAAELPRDHRSIGVSISGDEGRIMQSRAGGHVLGFALDKVYMGRAWICVDRGVCGGIRGGARGR